MCTRWRQSNKTKNSQLKMDYCCFKKEAFFYRQVELMMPAGAINRPQISLIVLNDFYLRGRSSVRYTVIIQEILQALHAKFLAKQSMRLNAVVRKKFQLGTLTILIVLKSYR